MTDLERQLRQYTEAAFDAVPETTAAEVMVDGPREVADPRGAIAASPGDRRPLRGARRRWPVAVAAALVLALVGVAVVVVDGDDDASRVGTAGRREPVTTGTDTDPVPSAAGEWTVDLGGEIPYAPVVVDGAVVVVTMSDDFSQSTVIALEEGGWEQDSTAASRRWSVDLGSPVVSQPVAAGGAVLLRLADERLAVLDSADGSVKWSVRTGDNVKGPPPPVVAGPTVYVGSQDGLVQALDLESGGGRWRDRLDQAVLAPPAVADGRVVVATGELPLGPDSRGGVTVYDGSGRRIEARRLADPVMKPPAARIDRYAAVTDALGGDASTVTVGGELVVSGGAVLGDLGQELSAPLLTREAVVVATPDGLVYSYATDDLEEPIWVSRLGARSQWPELRRQQRRLIAAGAMVAALDPRDGRVVWQAPVPDAFFGESDDPDRVVAISRRGSLAVVDVRDGSLVVDFALHDTPAGAVLHDGTLVWTGSGGVVTTARIGADPATNARVECATSSTGRAPDSGNGLTGEDDVRAVFDEIKVAPPRIDGADVVNVRLQPAASVGDGWRVVVTVSSVAACPAEVVIVNGVRIWYDAMR